VGLSKRFDLHEANRRVVACRDIGLKVRPGEFVGITGRSGSGKSTILRSIYRTNLPQEGSIWYDSARFGRVDLARADERTMLWLRRFELGYISQFLSVLPRTTAFDAVLQSALDSLEAQGEREADFARSEARRLLAHFDLPTTLWGLYPRTFSGGEKLRLNIAMAMIKRPRLLLLDEPTASLDNASKLKVRELIERLKEGGTTMLGIFHDLDFMEGLCDREYDMQEGLLDG
jgi:alpha-D-ribose 1-methylphosphonate 5-triphosphate synthase subunit PhnL